jgi:hypothetical protein
MSMRKKLDGLVRRVLVILALVVFLCSAFGHLMPPFIGSLTAT